MSNPQSVAIGFAHPGSVSTNFALSLLKFVQHDAAERKVYVDTIDCCGPYIPMNRNGIVELFLGGTKAEYLLSVDNDIQFSADAVYQLLDSADPAERPIVAGLYFTKYVDFTSTVWFSSGEGILRGVPKNIGPLEIQPGLQEIGACGMGFTLIHRGVLEHMRGKYSKDDPWPWFGHDIVGTAEGRIRVGEDFTFCLRAQALGYTVYGDARVRVRHLKTQVLDPTELLEQAAFSAPLETFKITADKTHKVLPEGRTIRLRFGGDD